MVGFFPSKAIVVNGPARPLSQLLSAALPWLWLLAKAIKHQASNINRVDILIVMAILIKRLEVD